MPDVEALSRILALGDLGRRTVTEFQVCSSKTKSITSSIK